MEHRLSLLEENVRVLENRVNALENEKKVNKDIEDKFKVVWEKYPKRLGKKQALRHFCASVKSDDDLKLLETALNRYLEYVKFKGIEEQYIQHGSTWFNNWKDWLEVRSVVNNSVKVEQVKPRSKQEAEFLGREWNGN
jgi:hypothetical protein